MEGFGTWQVVLEKVLCIQVMPLNMLIQGVIEWINSVIIILRSVSFLQMNFQLLKLSLTL